MRNNKTKQAHSLTTFRKQLLISDILTLDSWSAYYIKRLVVYLIGWLVAVLFFLCFLLAQCQKKVKKGNRLGFPFRLREIILFSTLAYKLFVTKSLPKLLPITPSEVCDYSYTA